MKTAAAQPGEQMLLLDDTFEDVMEALARAAGGKKVFAERLRPDLDGEPEKARRWFLDCMNENHAQQFHQIHIIRALKVGREIGCHIVKHWIDDETSYERSRPAAQPSRRVKLLAEDERIARRRRQIAEELEQIDTAGPDSAQRMKVVE